MRREHIEQMYAHADEGGQFSQSNVLDLLGEVERLTAEAIRLKADLESLQKLIAMQPSISYPVWQNPDGSIIPR
jgi:hypothetical protein